MGELVQIERLGKIFERVALSRADSRIERVLRREYNYGHIWRPVVNDPDRFEAISVIQQYVGQHYVEFTGLDQLIAATYRGAGSDV